MTCKSWKTLVNSAVFLAVISAAISVGNASKIMNVFIPGLGSCMGSQEATLGGNVDIFLGIPFAKPPVGSLRFQPPQNTTWSGVLNATKFGHVCPQINMLTGVPFGNEDCLTLNVYCPSNLTGSLPVMVWIHGGAFTMGASSEYDARVLARTENVIVVTVNYRLGILGFFNVPGTETKGNYGLLDQIAALRWVKKNIAAFGGDPKKVTIFGESAGAGSVSILSVSPLIKNEGLFIRSISQSGVASNPWVAVEVTGDEQAKFFGTKISCPMTGVALVNCLRRRTHKEIVQIQTVFEKKIFFVMAPIVDKHVLHDLPSKLQAQGKLVPIINEQLIGYNKEEGTMFAVASGVLPTSATKASLEKTIDGEMHRVNPPSKKMFKAAAIFEYSKYTPNNTDVQWYQSSSDYIGDLWFVRDIKDIVGNFAGLGKKVYFYQFVYLPKHLRYPMIGVSHALDIEFVFGSPLIDLPGFLLKNITAEDKIVSQNMMKMWANFAKTGNPGMSWPLYTNKEKKYMEIDLNLTKKEVHPSKKMAFWKDLVPMLDDKTVCKKCNHDMGSSADQSHISVCLLVAVVAYGLQKMF